MEALESKASKGINSGGDYGTKIFVEFLLMIFCRGNFVGHVFCNGWSLGLLRLQLLALGKVAGCFPLELDAMEKESLADPMKMGRGKLRGEDIGQEAMDEGAIFLQADSRQRQGSEFFLSLSSSHFCEEKIFYIF